MCDDIVFRKLQDKQGLLQAAEEAKSSSYFVVSVACLDELAL